MLMAIPIGIVVLISSLSPLWCRGSPLLHSLEITMSFSLSSTQYYSTFYNFSTTSAAEGKDNQSFPLAFIFHSFGLFFILLL